METFSYPENRFYFKHMHRFVLINQNLFRKGGASAYSLLRFPPPGFPSQVGQF